jgi:hypothetical protein
MFGLALASGTAVTILMKALFTTAGEIPGEGPKLFEKPIFLTFVMFVSMAAAWPLHYCLIPPAASSSASADAANEGTPLRAKEVAAAAVASAAAVQSDAASAAKSGHLFRLLILPCVFDLLGRLQCLVRDSSRDDVSHLQVPSLALRSIRLEQHRPHFCVGRRLSAHQVFNFGTCILCQFIGGSASLWYVHF